ncbi:MAG: hypothetical protein WB869_00175 [Candidatus Acidiferrales bacterium]
MKKIPIAKFDAKLPVLKAGPRQVASNVAAPVPDMDRTQNWKKSWWACEAIFLALGEIFIGRMIYNTLFHSVVNPAFSFYKPIIVLLLLLWMLELLGGRKGSILSALRNLLKVHRQELAE